MLSLTLENQDSLKDMSANESPKGAGVCDPFWLLSVPRFPVQHIHTFAHTHVVNSEVADEPRHDVDEGHTIQMCQTKSH